MTSVASSDLDPFNFGKALHRGLYCLSYGIWKDVSVVHGRAVAYTTSLILENLLYAFPPTIPRKYFATSKEALESIKDTGVAITYDGTLHISGHAMCTLDTLIKAALGETAEGSAQPSPRDLCQFFHVQSMLGSRYMKKCCDMYYGDAVFKGGLKDAVVEILIAVDKPVCPSGKEFEIPVRLHFLLDNAVLLERLNKL